MLNIINHFPKELLDCPSTELHNYLPGPSLIHLKGQREQPVFVSALLHGNETTGWQAIQALLQKYDGRELPRSLSIFIGNITAAKYGIRRLEKQVDYNRVWPHAELTDHSAEQHIEHAIMQHVIDEMYERAVFISVDIHNNTGINPHYACINRLDNSFYHLAVLFNRTVIYFTNPKGVQSQAFAELCPAVTIECGQVGHKAGITHAMQYIEACLGLSAIPTHPVLKQDIDLFHTVAIVKVPKPIRFSFTDPDADLLFDEKVDRMNFSELTEGTTIGTVNRSVSSLPLSVIDDDDNEVADRFFRLEGNRVTTACHLMPSMLSTDEDIIRQDCFCYLMERLTL